MFSAEVKGGVIVAEDVDLPEGVTVTVVVNDPEDDYAELTAEEAAERQATRHTTGRLSGPRKNSPSCCDSLLSISRLPAKPWLFIKVLEQRSAHACVTPISFSKELSDGIQVMDMCRCVEHNLSSDRSHQRG